MLNRKASLSSCMSIRNISDARLGLHFSLGVILMSECQLDAKYSTDYLNINISMDNIRNEMCYFSVQTGKVILQFRSIDRLRRIKIRILVTMQKRFSMQ